MTFRKTDLLWSKPNKPKKLNPETKIWTAFSKYIRLRDCLRTTGDSKVGKCCSCKKLITLGGNDAGHFITCGQAGTKYDVRNVHLQCSQCNRFQQGAWNTYYQFMESFYGLAVIKVLLQKKNEIFRGIIQDQKYWNTLRKSLEKAFIGQGQLVIKDKVTKLMKEGKLEEYLLEIKEN